MKHTLLSIFASATMFSQSGCSSIMGHVAPYEGYYPGVEHNVDMLQDDKNGWVMRSLLAVDLPFTAVLDTALLPYDYYRSSSGKESSRKRVADSDKKKQASGQMRDSGYKKPAAKK
ncbi:YceK/YidQ family lipoprotein [Leminorella richardii]|nr:YceK/YidQ family lipoprotein [Leminorella richardii]